MSDERTVLVDASAFITLAAVGETALLSELDGTVAVPAAVAAEVSDDPAASALDGAIADGTIAVLEGGAPLEQAAEHLGRSPDPTGDVALLGHALDREGVIVVTDDKPLRTACKTLSVPVSGSLGVLIRGVERDAIGPAEARDRLEAMDQVGARLSASLLRRAESLIDDAATA